MQNIPRLLPHIQVPEWLAKRIQEKNFRQLNLSSFLHERKQKDIEDALPIFRDKEAEKIKSETTALEAEMKMCKEKCPKPSSDYDQWVHW